MRSFWLPLLLLFGVLNFTTGCGSSDPKVETHSKDSSDTRLRLLNQEINEHPDKAELYYQRARYFGNKQKYFEALEDIRQAIHFDSVNALYHFTGGELLFKANQSRRAVNALQEATRLNPSYTEAWEKLGELYLIVKEYDSSERCWKKLQEIDPKNPKAPVFRGIMFLEKGDTLRAIRSFQYALEVDPGQDMAMIQLGQIYAEKGDPTCLQYFQSLLNINPKSWEAYLFRSHYYLNRGRHEQAIRDIDKTLSLNPDAYLANYYAGFIFYEKGNAKAALDQFSEVIRKKEDYLYAYYSRAMCYIKLGDKAKAAKDLDLLLEKEPGFSAATELKKTLKIR